MPASWIKCPTTPINSSKKKSKNLDLSTTINQNWKSQMLTTWVLFSFRANTFMKVSGRATKGTGEESSSGKMAPFMKAIGKETWLMGTVV